MSSPQSLAVVVATGERLASLRALRDRLAADLDACGSARDVVGLAGRLTDVLAQIEAAERENPTVKGTALDELAKRRKAAGRSDASGAPRATGKAQ